MVEGARAEGVALEERAHEGRGGVECARRVYGQESPRHAVAAGARGAPPPAPPRRRSGVAAVTHDPRRRLPGMLAASLDRHLPVRVADVLVEPRDVHVVIDRGVAGGAPQQERGVVAVAVAVVVVVVRVVVREGEGILVGIIAAIRKRCGVRGGHGGVHETHPNSFSPTTPPPRRAGN